MDKFWMCWNPAGASPTVKHPSKQSAMLEAHRLVMENRAHQIFIMESLSYCEKEVPPVVWVETKEAP